MLRMRWGRGRGGGGGAGERMGGRERYKNSGGEFGSGSVFPALFFFNVLIPFFQILKFYWNPNETTLDQTAGRKEMREEGDKKPGGFFRRGGSWKWRVVFLCFFTVYCILYTFILSYCIPRTYDIDDKRIISPPWAD